MKKILTMLKLRHMTSTHLRQATGLSRATISRIVAGRTPSAKSLALIAEALEVSSGRPCGTG